MCVCAPQFVKAGIAAPVCPHTAVAAAATATALAHIRCLLANACPWRACVAWSYCVCFLGPGAVVGTRYCGCTSRGCGRSGVHPARRVRAFMLMRCVCTHGAPLRAAWLHAHNALSGSALARGGMRCDRMHAACFAKQCALFTHHPSWHVCLSFAHIAHISWQHTLLCNPPSGSFTRVMFSCTSHSCRLLPACLTIAAQIPDTTWCAYVTDPCVRTAIHVSCCCSSGMV